MGREQIRYERKRLHVWILANQEADIKQLREVTGKTKTDVISEALSIYFSMLRKQGVL